MAVRVKTAKGRALSSTKWLERQLNDPYVIEARKLGYRSRAVFKLIEMDKRFRFFRGGSRVLDLGSAPGSWSQYAVQRVNSRGDCELVYAVDAQRMPLIKGVKFIQCDIRDDELLKGVFCGRKFDVIMSDMAPASCGCRFTDHVNSINLCRLALNLSIKFIAQDGFFITKAFQGEEEEVFFKEVKQYFSRVYHVKPKSSRSESSELYIVGVRSGCELNF